MQFGLKIMLLILTLSAGGVCIGQKAEERKSDDGDKQSSKALYKKFSSSRESPERLLREAERLKLKSPVDALNKVKEALAVSVARGDELTEAKCYLLLGEINESIQEWKLAVDNYAMADQKLRNSFPKAPELRDAQRGLGTSNLNLGNYPESLTAFQNAQAGAGRSFQKELKLDISEVYYRMEKYDDALKSLDDIPAEKISDGSFENKLQVQRAKIYARKNDLDKAKDTYSNTIQSLNASQKPIDNKEKAFLQSSKDEISEVLRDNNLYDDEIALRNQSVLYNTNILNFSEVTKDKVAIGNSLEAKGEFRAALREFEAAARIADTINDPKAKAAAYLSLADVYGRNGRDALAISAYKKYSGAIQESEKVNESQLQERSTILKKQRDIEEINRDIYVGKQEVQLEEQTVFRQQLIIYGLLFITLITLVTSYFIYKNAQASKVANQLLALKSLRSQMNPHFIFNALNSVNQFIAQQDERAANKFLSEFSQLMRLVLENSQEDFIPLFKEQEILTLYLKLEHYRFRDKFEYEIKIDEGINAEAIEVPPMLIQPYIENAVWHGLRYKDDKGKLIFSIKQISGDLVVEIEDNGIGRRRSAELKTAYQRKHNSTGLKNIEERLLIINKVYHSNYRVTIEDLPDDSGTRVFIYLPTNRNSNRML